MRHQAHGARQAGEPGGQELRGVWVKPGLAWEEVIGEPGREPGGLVRDVLDGVEAECQLVHYTGVDVLELVIKLDTGGILVFFFEILYLSVEP